MMQLHTSCPSNNEPPPPSVDFVVEYAALAYAEGVMAELADTESTVVDVEACTLSPVIALAVLHGDESTPDQACDLSQLPASYKLAQGQEDWDKWEVAMCCKKQSLEEKHIFEHVLSLPVG